MKKRKKNSKAFRGQIFRIKLHYIFGMLSLNFQLLQNTQNKLVYSLFSKKFNEAKCESLIFEIENRKTYNNSIHNK